jgi:hypothetical protein
VRLTAARVALRFAADGTDEDPGESVVHHEHRHPA